MINITEPSQPMMLLGGVDGHKIWRLNDARQP
jgi:hypothetical protein